MIKNSKRRWLDCLLLIVFLMILACTENPFDTPDQIQVSDNTITGKIKLNDGSSPQHVYVWLEGFDLGAYPNSNGEFKIILPPPQLQPNGGISGAFNLFYYLSNFKLDSTQITMQNGKLVLDFGDVNEYGALRRSKYLRKILKINMTVEPNRISEDFPSGVAIDLTLEATEDTIYIRYPNRSAGPLAILFFKSCHQEVNLIRMFENSIGAVNAPLYTDSITADRKQWEIGFRLQSNFLPIGDYEIIPYFVILQESIPADLLDDFGSDLRPPDDDFVNIPTLRTGNRLTLTQAEVLP